MYRCRKNSGFTLIEVLVVMVILGILAAIIVPRIMDRPEQARVVAARNDVRAIVSALDLYRLDNGTYPSTEQGLAALVRKPDSGNVPENWRPGGYLDHMPKDPWGHDYQYLNPGLHGEIDVFSYGPDGPSADGGSSSNEIGNWNLSR